MQVKQLQASFEAAIVNKSGQDKIKITDAWHTANAQQIETLAASISALSKSNAGCIAARYGYLKNGAGTIQWTEAVEFLKQWCPPEYIARCAIGKALTLSAKGDTAFGRRTERIFSYTRLYRRGWWKLYLLNRLPARLRPALHDFYNRMAWRLARKGL